MHKILRALLLGAIFAFPTLSAAQFSESYSFLKAVKDRDGTEATKYVSKPGSVIIDTHDISNGETALHIVAKDRDLTWLHFLLGKGAKPDSRDKTGETPLLIATRQNFIEGAEVLLAFQAGVDTANNNGETPLILAVQNRNLALVKLYLEQGANPNKADHIAGLSARDYAERDTRTPALLKAFEDSKPAKPRAKQGPHL